MKFNIIVLTLLILMFLCSCKNQSSVSIPTGEYNKIDASEYNLNIKVGEGAILGDYVDNAVTAQSIGDAVIKSIVGEDKFNKLIGCSVSYDEKNGIWLINRNMGPDVAGGDYTCAIRKNNGEILKVWVGE